MNRTEPLVICTESRHAKPKNDIKRTVAISETYFALANIRRADNNLLPPLQDYGIDNDMAIQRDIKRSIQRLREEIDVYEKAVSELFAITARPEP